MAEPVILIVDDEVGVTRLCQRLLGRAGYQVVAMNQPKEAVQFLENKPVDLLLADIRMPEMDGFHLLELGKQLQSDLAVVIMTGYGTVETAVESLRKGADGMVLKPFSGAELIQSVEQALREKQREQEIQRLRVLRPLFDITESLFAEKDPLQLQQLIMDVVCDHLSCPYAGYFVQQDDAFVLLIEQGAALSNDIARLLPQVINLEAPLVIGGDTPVEPELQNLLTRFGLTALLCVPILFGRKSSLMLAGRGADAPAFSNADIEMSVILSRQAAIALENAELYAELQEHLHQIERSQQALIQAEKMAAVGRLTASIAHEINNPLQSVRNCLHLIEHGNLSEDGRTNYLNLATEELDRLMHAAKRMLDFYRPSALDRSPVNVNDLLSRVFQLMGAQLRDHEVVIRPDLKPGLPEVMAVGNQIQQVILNIILNAMDAMSGGGEVFVRTDLSDNHVIILLEDTGPGIPESERENIFEPFVTSKEKGLGLGLTVSYGIITAHGGTLELLPFNERGARFRIKLPVGR